MLKKPETDAFLFLSKLFDFQCSDAIEGQYHLALQDPCTTLLLPEPKEAILPTLWSRFLLKVLIVTSSDKEKRNQEVRTEWEVCTKRCPSFSSRMAAMFLERPPEEVCLPGMSAGSRCLGQRHSRCRARSGAVSYTAWEGKAL